MNTPDRPVKLSGAVMTHPRRLEEAREVAATDPQGRITVVVDPEPDGRPTALRVAPLSWDCVAPDATHHMVLQDDVAIADGFFAYAEQVAAAAGDEAVAFYAGWETRNGAVARLAALTGDPWAYTLQEHVPCYALMLPAELARGYARFQAEDEPGWPYDVVVQRYLNARGVRVRFCTPSLVQHMDMPSLAGNAYHGLRQATSFAERAGDPEPYEAVRFPVVPFYQYGLARCAVRHEEGWEYVETERHLKRIGLLDDCLAALASAAASPLSDETRRAVWVTAYTIGVVTAGSPAPDTATAEAAMRTLGPGGLCEDYPVDELLALARPIAGLATDALRAGRRARRADAARPTAPAGSRTVVTGGSSRFARQLAGLLGDGGLDAVHRAEPPSVTDLTGARYVVHLGGAVQGDDQRLDGVLKAAEAAGVERLVYAGSYAVYRGSAAERIDEDALTAAPQDPVALAWWQEEQRCREWGERTGIPVQVLRLGEPVGPYAPREGACVQWVHLAWTRHPLVLAPGDIHQVLDYRDMADAIGAVLAAEPSRPVFNIATAACAEEELAGLVADVSRRTPRETGPHTAPRNRHMVTDLIESELGWTSSASLVEGLRDLAQWYACDIHGGDLLP
ncbi:NAD-dependent epimerase/dehydratase family protein [Streptomyces sp. NPDC014735]|uniref:NAD-dependent epimerase/dehydratase family protein n=1 Tax=unclassified Streptomyces TaxID=2593676 RepID=UPI0036F92B8F